MALFGVSSRTALLIIIYHLSWMGTTNGADPSSTRYSFQKSRMIRVSEEVSQERTPVEVSYDGISLRTADRREPPGSDENKHYPSYPIYFTEEAVQPTQSSQEENGNHQKLQKVLKTVVNASMEDMVEKLTVSLQEFLNSPSKVRRIKTLLAESAQRPQTAPQMAPNYQPDLVFKPQMSSELDASQGSLEYPTGYVQTYEYDYGPQAVEEDLSDPGVWDIIFKNILKNEEPVFSSQETIPEPRRISELRFPSQNFTSIEFKDNKNGSLPVSEVTSTPIPVPVSFPSTEFVTTNRNSSFVKDYQINSGSASKGPAAPIVSEPAHKDKDTDRNLEESNIPQSNSKFSEQNSKSRKEKDSDEDYKVLEISLDESSEIGGGNETGKYESPDNKESDFLISEKDLTNSSTEDIIQSIEKQSPEVDDLKTIAIGTTPSRTVATNPNSTPRPETDPKEFRTGTQKFTQTASTVTLTSTAATIETLPTSTIITKTIPPTYSTPDASFKINSSERFFSVSTKKYETTTTTKTTTPASTRTTMTTSTSTMPFRTTPTSRKVILTTTQKVDTATSEILIPSRVTRRPFTWFGGVRYIVTAHPINSTELQNSTDIRTVEESSETKKPKWTPLFLQTILIGGVAGFAILLFTVFGATLACQRTRKKKFLHNKRRVLPYYNSDNANIKGLPRVSDAPMISLSSEVSATRRPFYYDTSRSQLSLVADRTVETFFASASTLNTESQDSQSPQLNEQTAVLY